MDILYGFAHLGQLVDNTPDVVGPVGELSSYSMTFARDKLIYTNATDPGLTFVNFFYQNDVERLTLAAANQALIIKLCNWIYQQGRSGNFSENIQEFQNTFLAEHSDEVAITDSGAMVTFGASQWCPEFITIVPAGNSDVAWTIWFSDSAFRNQCPISTIYVVQPILELDDFFGTPSSVKGMVVPPDIQTMNDAAESIKGEYPYTALRTWRFDWVNPTDVTDRTPTFWLTVHYGDAGNNLDKAKEAIVEHILKDSDRGREDWAEIFPDLFTSTEFIIIPHYDLIARESMSRQPAIYSPVTNADKSLDDALANVRGTGYNQSHIEDVLEVAPTLYRSLAVSIVGGPENRDGIDRFSKRYPDYMNIATTHVDFGYMEKETREFVMILNEMIYVAEQATPSSSIPRKFNRITRDDKTYIAINFENFLYLVVPKYDYGQAVQPQ